MARINASINISKIKNEVVKDPTLIAFKNKAGEAYVNVTIWINHELDDFNNDVSIQINPPKEHVELANKIYIGNGKTDTALVEIKRRKELAESKLKTETAKKPDEPKDPVFDEAGVEIPVTGDDLPF